MLFYRFDIWVRKTSYLTLVHLSYIYVTLISTIISVLALTLNILGIHSNIIMHLHLFLLAEIFLVVDM